MNILIYDYLFVKGHIHPNTHYIKLIANEHKVSVISISSIYEELAGYANIIKIKSKYTNSDIKKSRIKQTMFCGEVVKQVKIKDYDAVLFLSYDNDSFAIAYHMFPKDIPLILQSHNNIDKLTQNVIHRACFSIYKNKVRHVVYEDFMKKSLVNEYKVERNRIYVLPRARFSYDVCDTDKDYAAIGLSGSNSDDYIEKLVREAEQNPEDYKNTRIILKAHREITTNTHIVEVINNRVSDQEYKELFNSTRVVLDPLPKTFRYRMSAVLFEALSSRKIVIGSDTEIIRAFAVKYPHICKVASSPSDMLKLVKGISKEETQNESREFDQFNLDYSDERTMSVFNQAFTN